MGEMGEMFGGHVIYAKEMEMGLAQMRHADPETFFAAISDLGAQTVEAYWKEQSDQH